MNIIAKAQLRTMLNFSIAQCLLKVITISYCVGGAVEDKECPSSLLNVYSKFRLVFLNSSVTIHLVLKETLLFFNQICMMSLLPVCVNEMNKLRFPLLSMNPELPATFMTAGLLF